MSCQVTRYSLPVHTIELYICVVVSLVSRSTEPTVVPVGESLWK